MVCEAADEPGGAVRSAEGSFAADAAVGRDREHQFLLLRQMTTSGPGRNAPGFGSLIKASAVQGPLDLLFFRPT